MFWPVPAELSYAVWHTLRCSIRAKCGSSIYIRTHADFKLDVLLKRVLWSGPEIISVNCTSRVSSGPFEWSALCCARPQRSPFFFAINCWHWEKLDSEVVVAVLLCVLRWSRNRRSLVWTWNDCLWFCRAPVCLCAGMSSLWFTRKTSLFLVSLYCSYIMFQRTSHTVYPTCITHSLSY